MRFTVTARCIAAAVFGAMEVWMLGDDRSLGELARVCHLALETLRAGITESWPRQVSSQLTKLCVHASLRESRLERQSR